MEFAAAFVDERGQPTGSGLARRSWQGEDRHADGRRPPCLGLSVAGADRVLDTGLVERAASARAPRLTPLAADHLGGAVVLGVAAVIFLGVPPLIADGERLLYWSDLFLVAFAIGGAVWLRRRRSDYKKAAMAPSTAKLAANASVIRRHVAWGVPYGSRTIGIPKCIEIRLARPLRGRLVIDGHARERRSGSAARPGRCRRVSPRRV
jgi:hypothetical protein